ncbi:hypothetical protein SSP35_04_02720 [Streptomyces sp. NBRC 110611]|nr:hypothetical protein SSP35_04_02720 [Streptomyces sp. NBRC 110611]
MLVDKPHAPEYLDNVLNAIHACRTVGGLTIEQVWVSEESLRAEVFYSPSGRALGNIARMDRILEITREAEHQVDALAITSQTDVRPDLRRAYYAGKPVANPWGGVEAVLTHAVTTMTGLPAAHAPMLTSHVHLVPLDGVVDPRDGAETISTSFLCSVLRGLSAAPPSPAPPAPPHSPATTGSPPRTSAHSCSRPAPSAASPRSPPSPSASPSPWCAHPALLSMTPSDGGDPGHPAPLGPLQGSRPRPGGST